MSEENTKTQALILKQDIEVLGEKEIAALHGPVIMKVVRVIEKNAYSIVVEAIRNAKRGDYRSMKFIFDLLERFEAELPEERTSVAKVLLKHLGLTEATLAAEIAAEEGDVADVPDLPYEAFGVGTVK